MSTDTQHADRGDAPRNGLLQDVSNEMVRLYKHQFGRGQTKTRTYWSGPDILTVVLEDTLTPTERNLVKMGEHQRLRDTRMFFQYATVREFCEPIEALTGRKVRSFISGVDTKRRDSRWSSSCSADARRATTARHASSERSRRSTAATTY